MRRTGRKVGHREALRPIRPLPWQAGIVGVCPKCGQWQREQNGGDCLNECRRRGFAPPDPWERRVRELEAEGLTRSDAQAAADAEARAKRQA